jgi:PAS domain S-box-containing protein
MFIQVFGSQSAFMRVCRRKFYVSVGACFLTLASCSNVAVGAEIMSEPVPLATVLEDVDGDFVPDRMGQVVTVQGVITADPLVTGRNSALANMQDASGGILLFTRSPSRFENRFKAGDEVRATGTVGQYQGAEQIIVSEIEVVKESMIPPPRLATAAELNSEVLSGRLVRVRGRMRLIEKPDADGARAELVDETGTIQVFIPNRFYSDPEFLGALPELHEAEVVGILSQKVTEPPFNTGYRLVPRTPDDFSFFPAPPYRFIVISTSAALLAVASIILWASRRQAIRVNREMLALTESLQQSQSRLREHQARLSLLTEQVPAIVWSVDRELRFTSSIGAGLKSLNQKQDAVVGMTLFEYFKTDDIRVPAIAAHRRAISGSPATFGATWSGRTYECHLVPLRNGAGDIVGAVGLALDITERSQVEQAMEEQAENLRHSQKMEAVGRLAGGVAHDFNNLVTVIKGYCDLISFKLGKNHDLQDWFEEIKNSANRAASLTSQLLAFSRKQVLEPRVLDLNEVLADMNRLLRRIIGEHIELTIDLAPNLGNVKVDKSQFEQVIMNLAVNAYDAMPRGGRLSVKTENCTLTGAEGGAVGQLAPGDYAMVSFTDEGEGMTPEVLSRVFEPFFTTKEVGKGTGLGLATVYGIISQSGGVIDVQSAPGEGTTFRIFLPVVAEAASVPAVTLPTNRNTRGTECVLVAEDEDAVRELMRRTLEDQGYQVIEAANGEEALRLSRDYSGTIDLLLTDIVMPRMSGFKLAKFIRDDRPEIKTLFVSGYAYTGRHEGETISPDTFLAKPFSPDVLAMKVRRVLSEPAVKAT